MYQNFIIPYLYEAQHVSDDTPSIIRCLKLHRQPLIFHTWKVNRRVVRGLCQAHCAWQSPQSPSIKVKFIKKNPTRCSNVSKFYHSIFIWNSTCYGRHTAHHQEPKTVVPASGFLYVEGCSTCSWWTLSGTEMRRRIAPSHYCNWQRPRNTRPNNLTLMENQRLSVQVVGSWWWVVCRPKHVELHINIE